jgi:hypothetical protein
MFSKKLLLSSALISVAATIFAITQNDASAVGKGMTLMGRYARLTFVTERPQSFTTTNILEPGLTTIFNSLAAKYPKGLYLVL